MDPSSHEYELAVEELRAETVGALRFDRGERLARSTIESFLIRAYRIGMVAQEIIDLFCVSTPSILEDARLSDAEAQAAVRVFDEVHVGVRRRLGLSRAE